MSVDMNRTVKYTIDRSPHSNDRVGFRPFGLSRLPHERGLDERGPDDPYPWHVTVFDIKAGEPLEGPGEDRTRTFGVRVEGGEIRLKTSE